MLVLICIGSFVLESIAIAFVPNLAAFYVKFLALNPTEAFSSFFLWQLLTYQFLHASTSHILFNMLALYMFGSTMESYWGTRRFLIVYNLCVLGGGALFSTICYLHAFGLDPALYLVGASGGIMGMVVAFGIAYAGAEVFLFPFPVAIKAQYLAMIMFGISVLSALRYENPGTAFAHLGGALMGFFYIRIYGKRGVSLPMSEYVYRIRNWFARWQRKQAAKKFEVYMRDIDKEKHFDDEGNLRGPKGGNGEGGPGRWVN